MKILIINNNNNKIKNNINNKNKKTSWKDLLQYLAPKGVCIALSNDLVVNVHFSLLLKMF